MRHDPLEQVSLNEPDNRYVHAVRASLVEVEVTVAGAAQSCLATTVESRTPCGGTWLTPVQSAVPLGSDSRRHRNCVEFLIESLVYVNEVLERLEPREVVPSLTPNGQETGAIS